MIEMILFFLSFIHLYVFFVSLDSGEQNEQVTIVYTPSHLYHILFELYKNAMRAVVESHKEGADLPPIKTIIVKAKEDVTIKVFDFVYLKENKFLSFVFTKKKKILFIIERYRTKVAEYHDHCVICYFSICIRRRQSQRFPG